MGFGFLGARGLRTEPSAMTMAGSAFAASGSAAVSAAFAIQHWPAERRRSQAFRLWLPPAFPVPPFCRECLRWWWRELRAEHGFLRLRQRRPERLPWPVRARWFCGSAPLDCGHAQIADGRFGHGLHIRAEAGARDFLLQFFRPLLQVRACGVPAPVLQVVLALASTGGFLNANRRIQSPSRKLVRNNRLMKHSAR